MFRSFAQSQYVTDMCKSRRLFFFLLFILSSSVQPHQLFVLKSANFVILSPFGIAWNSLAVLRFFSSVWFSWSRALTSCTAGCRTCPSVFLKGYTKVSSENVCNQRLTNITETSIISPTRKHARDRLLFWCLNLSSIHAVMFTPESLSFIHSHLPLSTFSLSNQIHPNSIKRTSMNETYLYESNKVLSNLPLSTYLSNSPLSNLQLSNFPPSNLLVFFLSSMSDRAHICTQPSFSYYLQKGLICGAIRSLFWHRLSCIVSA